MKKFYYVSNYSIVISRSGGWLFVKNESHNNYIYFSTMKKLLLLFLFMSFVNCSSGGDDGTNLHIVQNYTLTVTSQTGGSVVPSSGSYPSGEKIILTATPDSGYIFTGWSDGSTKSSLTITINLNLTITPIFGLLDVTQPTITLVGSDTINLTIGATFSDPGATASDDVDGDLSNSITKSKVPDTLIA